MVAHTTAVARRPTSAGRRRVRILLEDRIEIVRNFLLRRFCESEQESVGNAVIS